MIFRDFEQITQFITAHLDAETRNCEYKGGEAWDGEFKYNIVKGILAMSSIQDGGSIIIGVNENTSTRRLEPNGISADNAKTYRHDNVIQFVNDKYADPFVTILLQQFTHEDKTFINIHVYEFEDTPIICKKDYANILQKGRIYSRSYSKPQSTADLTSAEMREIIDLAVDKKYQREEHRKTSRKERLTETIPIDHKQLFKNERSDF